MIVFDFMHWLGMSVAVLCPLWDWPSPLMNVRCRYSKTAWVCEVIWEVIEIPITYIHFIPIRYLPLYNVSKLCKSTSYQPIDTAYMRPLLQYYSRCPFPVRLQRIVANSIAPSFYSYCRKFEIVHDDLIMYSVCEKSIDSLSTNTSFQ